MITLLAGLYASAMAVLFVFGVNHLILSRHAILDEGVTDGPVPTPRGPASTGAASWPHVTVQLPLFNERDVAERLIGACLDLDYPRDRLEIQVLDDSTDETTAIVARVVSRARKTGFEIIHVRREHRDGFKAGALANGLSFARGEFFAIFDADFVPRPDFLRRTLPRFGRTSIGLVQARWEHINAGDSVLTNAQAALLDAHFQIEQRGRRAAGWMISFNGTAGVWRRQCIESAGGWQSDTLTEDLDLSYRAQLNGWDLEYLPDESVPSELPATMSAWRQQQFRWTKGTAETCRKLLLDVLRSDDPLPRRLQGAAHLMSFAVYPALLVAAMVHAPVLAAHAADAGISDTFLGVMGVGLLPLAGMALAHLTAQRSLHPDWRRRIVAFPVWLMATMGLAVHNSRAAAEGLLGRRSIFARTPKGSYQRRASSINPAEAVLALYFALGLVLLVGVGGWVALPFQLMFMVAFAAAAVADPLAARTAASRSFIAPQS